LWGVTKFGFWDPPPIAVNVWWIGGNAGGIFLSWSQEGLLGYQIFLLVSCWNYFVGHLVTLLTFGRYKAILEKNFWNCQESLKFGGGLGFHTTQTLTAWQEVRCEVRP
jgi:hypothetical protein